MTGDFLFYSLILLLAAVIVVPIAKRSGLGTVLGYIVAGVIIGPFGFGFITEAETLLHFSEFGVVMMLFLIGLELEPKVLWRLRKSLLGLGSSQVLITTTLITLTGMAFGISWPIALTIGMGLTLSSTAICLQIMGERALFPTKTGQSAFSVLLFQDLAIIPILAIIPLLATVTASDVKTMADVLRVVENGSGGSLWEKSLKVVGLVTLLIAFGHYAVRHALHYIARTGVREIFTATALLLVVGVTFIMLSAGLTPAMGAFIAGVILADSEYKHEIENQIEPFKSLLLGLFFISVGMSINFEVFSHYIPTVVGATIGLVAGKLLVLFFLAKFMKFNVRDNLMFSILLAQGGEFAFVIFQFASNVKLLSMETTSILNVIVAISMMATPLLILFYDKVLTPWLDSRKTGLVSPILPPLNEHNPVIIFGYGRFGQIIGRLLQAKNIGATILDHDPTQIDFLRKFGWKVYYGEVLDMHLLEKAGIENAKMIIIGIDDFEKSVEATKRIKETYPHVKVLVRAYDRRNAQDFIKAGADFVERETFASALNVSEAVLRFMGYRAFTAKNLVRKFAAHDRKSLEEATHLSDNDKDWISFALESRQQLIDLFEKDRLDAEAHKNENWEQKIGEPQ